MFLQEQIKKIVEQNIINEEVLGEQPGGSGHLGNITYSVDDIRTRNLSDRITEIIYQYRLITETEFTYYPDNPPYETKYEKRLRIDDKGKIIFEGEKKCIGSNMDFEIPSNDE